MHTACSDFKYTVISVIQKPIPNSQKLKIHFYSAVLCKFSHIHVADPQSKHNSLKTRAKNKSYAIPTQVLTYPGILCPTSSKCKCEPAGKITSTSSPTEQ